MFTEIQVHIRGIIQQAEFKVRSIPWYSVTDFSLALGLKILYDNIAAGAMHNSKERYDSPKCHPDTRKAVLSDITSWISDHSKETCILWLITVTVNWIDSIQSVGYYGDMIAVVEISVPIPENLKACLF